MASQGENKKHTRSYLERLGLKQKIESKKAEIDYATSISLAPIDVRINVDNDFVRFVKKRLVNRPVVKGDTISIMMLNHSVPFIVINTQPTDIVKISPTTEINILKEPQRQPSSPLRSRGVLCIPVPEIEEALKENITGKPIEFEVVQKGNIIFKVEDRYVQIVTSVTKVIKSEQMSPDNLPIYHSVLTATEGQEVIPPIGWETERTRKERDKK